MNIMEKQTTLSGERKWIVEEKSISRVIEV
jgi:hypothetical protein